jgi:hypothetical protein
VQQEALKREAAQQLKSIKVRVKNGMKKAKETPEALSCLQEEQEGPVFMD